MTTQDNILELKKYAVEKAIQSGSIENMRAIYEFLKPEITIGAHEKTKEPVILHKKLPALNFSQPKILGAAIAMLNNGDDVNGVALAKRIGMSQAQVSMTLRKLISYGYMTREGNRFYVRFDADGNAYSPSVKRYPSAPANGYKLKDVARISV